MAFAVPFSKAAAVPFSRQLWCLCQGSCGAFFKAVGKALRNYEVDLRLSRSNLSCCRAPVGFEPTKAAGKHTSLGRHSQEHATTLARLQHTQKRENRTGRIKGQLRTLEESGKTERVTLQTT